MPGNRNSQTRRQRPRSRAIKSLPPIVGRADNISRPFLADDQIYGFRRMYDSYSFNQITATQNLASRHFTLAGLSAASDFSSLFDQYRITQIHVRISPCMTTLQPAALAAAFVPQLYYVVDYDDDTVPTSINELKQYSNCNLCTYETVQFSFKPQSQSVMYTNAGNVAAGTLKDQWIDVAVADVYHYGLKFAMTAASANAPLQSWTVDFWLDVEFRHPR